MRGALSIAIVVALTGCGDTDPDPPAAGSTGASGTTSGPSGSSGGDTVVETAGAADTTAGTTADVGECVALYGRPSERTGLTEDQCRPECPCLDGWVMPQYDEDDIAALEALTLDNPPAELDEDPYLSEPPGLPPDLVCGVLLAGVSYSLQTYDDRASAETAGAIVTHAGPCGRCSPLADLAVYMRQGDLTDPVRECGVLGLTQGDDATLQCLLDLGFSMPCAQIWLYNTVNTRDSCFSECIDALDQPYHLPDGTLNPCLTCDEQMSGPVFKAIAGRTRRNTGLASALCRPCDQVQQIVHVYE